MWAIPLIAAIIGFAGSMYSASEAKKGQEDIKNKELEAEAQAQKIRQRTRQEEEGATLTFGSRQKQQNANTYDSFIRPRTASALGSSTTSSGLGFNV